MRHPTPLPRALLEEALRHGGVVGVAQCDRYGVDKFRRHRLVASGRWTRLTQGTYLTDVVPTGVHELDLARQRAAWSGSFAFPGAIVVGAAALVLHGIKGLPRTVTPEVALPDGARARSRDGIVVRQYDARMRVVDVAGRPVAAPEWAFAQAAPLLPVRELVSAMDSAANKGVIDDVGLARAHEIARGRRWISRAHLAWQAYDGRAESPPETHARLMCREGGIGPDDLQREIFDARGRFLARADLAWFLGGDHDAGADRWLLVEIDSDEFHTSAQEVRADAVRQNGLLAVGRHVLLRYFARHLRDERSVVGQIRSVLDAEGWVPGRSLPPAYPVVIVRRRAV
ncbi:type IV toxin-antitoxin system AbiEi family antitoxin domain-containing protein [Antribacter sp. KLBMP9083]|uniref:Type IV toxin-antitoxin system AbiEi family antitoxin domain-containing protein n=1 Tax=Antribacter soli TaxID=2910976 RepID=A0AA41QCC2_9MICO|nr:type IV toxin-antitoxin system AbiEi family antitoxin domain-containing protein [Antribacter soli]MCF4120835.1 type IV toxin-antitoxin system AbiEi family antitoxin domain-containing protein [Antribacter soli]